MTPFVAVMGLYGETRLLFDAYHVARMGLDPAATFRRLLPVVRHVQVADSPGRHEPGSGGIGFDALLESLTRSNHRGWLSAEYLPLGDTVSGLGCLKTSSYIPNNCPDSTDACCINKVENIV